MKANVDRNSCIGCGMCAEICPEVFRMDGEGLAEAYAQPDENNRAAAAEAAESCPAEAIKTQE
jgi:ferredoxin